MVRLTFKELTHKKGKLILMILGIAFSIFLVQYSAGMWNGVLSKSSEVYDAYGFDAWIQEKGNDIILDNGVINETVYDRVKQMEKINEIERLIYWFTGVETEDYTMQSILIGYELNSKHMEVWNLIKGDVKDLEKNNTIIIDKTFNNYFDDLDVGDKILINRVEMEIVGICQGCKFMGNPYAWTSLQNAKKIAPWAGDWISTIGVDLEDGYTVDEFKDDIKKLERNNELDDVSVYSIEELRENTYDMIVNEGGMGGSIYIIVAMGYFVALIIISVSMYQTIQEKIPEYGTLKAIGIKKGFLNRMLLYQVFIIVSLSFVIATILTYMMGIFMNDVAIVPVSVSISASIMLYGITMLLSTLCALVSIRKVHKIDPAIVFRG